MKILYLCTFYHRAILFRQQMDALKERGYEVKAFSSAEYGDGIAPKFQPLMDDLVKHYECWNKVDRVFFFPRQYKIEHKLKKAYNIRNFDLVHAHLMLSSGYTCLRLKKQYGIKYVVSVRSTDLTGFIKLPLFKSMAKNILSEASGILFLSHVHKRRLFAVLDPKFASAIEYKCAVIGNCIERYWEENIYQGKRKIDLNREIKILTVAKIRPVKNIISAAKAVMELRERGYNVRLTVVGENQDNEEYKKICSFPCVTILPFMAKERLLHEYRTHDIFLLPSVGETFGRVYVEAMSQGLPVLYSKNQGFDGNYKDGTVGYSVEAKDYERIADCVEKVIKDYDSISERCIEKSSDFFENNIMNRMEDFYKESILR